MAHRNNQFDATHQDRYHPFSQYEYVDVSFGAANTDTPVYYQILRPNNPDDVRFLDVSRGAVYTGGADSVPQVYLSASPSRLLAGQGYVMLRSTVANYSTRLLLFVER